MTISNPQENPRLLNLHVLELLGYRPTGRGIENEPKQIRILELRRSADDTIPDFVYCCHTVQDWGFIDPHTLDFYTSRVRLRGNESNPQGLN